MPELNAFAKIAEYLKDPLVLSGFVVLIAFLALRQLLKAGVIPNLGRGYGFRILRLALSFGFILGLAIILLGMGLKYRELSKEEQRRAASFIASELKANLAVVQELDKNAETFLTLSGGLAHILRDQRLQILSGLFPPENIDPTFNEAKLTNLYNDRIDWLVNARLWEDETQKRRTEEACGSINRFVNRTKSTADSLADRSVVRYPIARRAYDANLDVIRKIGVVDMTSLAELYSQLIDARILFDRVANSAVEYMQSVQAFCLGLPPTRDGLSTALALERLTFRLVPAYRQKLQGVILAIQARAAEIGRATGD